MEIDTKDLTNIREMPIQVYQGPTAAPTLATPPPAPLQGMYCRGSACQYRVPPPVLPPPTAPPIADYFNLLRNREFCRGKACLGGPYGLHGWPANAAGDAFALNCGHLYNDVAGGMQGKDGERNIKDVRDSFMQWCPQRVAYLEKGACPGYADVVVMALSPTVASGQAQGGSGDVCLLMSAYIGAVKGAEMDLKLTEAALPKVSLIAQKKSQSTAQSMAMMWKSHLEKKRIPYVSEFGADNLNLMSVQSCGTLNSEAMAPTGPVAGRSTGNGLPKYNPAPVCQSYKGQSGSKVYQVLPGAPDGSVPPVEINGPLFEHCTNQFAEIMAGFGQYGKTVVGMTKDWCAWKSSVTDWVNTPSDAGRPDWTFRNCNGMVSLVAFSMKDHLDEGMGAMKVCKKLFLTLGAVHRVDSLVADAWKVSARGLGNLGLTTAVDPEAAKKLLEDAQAYSSGVFGKMREQRDAFNDLNAATMDISGFS